MVTTSSPDALKRLAAERALDFVDSGMRLGLGSGSTAAHFVAALGAKVRAGGLDVVGVPTSESTRRLAVEHGVPLTTLEETPELDLTVDGADEVDGRLRLIKGGGGALLREKIVAASSGRMIVIADRSKRVARLGRFPLPVEVVPFGHPSTAVRIARALAGIGLPTAMRLRQGSGDGPYRTDGGNLIYDCDLGEIPNPETLDAALSAVPGVVEHGLFIGLCACAIIAGPDGIELLERG
jgi:ribose 5-phosphate isomerase A